VPQVESLEDRTVPAGNVRVQVFEGVLYVSGDDRANQVMISATGKSSAIVRALDATTTINGRSAVAVEGIKRDYYIDMFGGDDVLVLNATRNGRSVRVGLGDGNDTLIMNDAQNRGPTTIFGGAGDDTITLSNSGFRRYVFADTGAGDDQVNALGIHVADLGLQNPSGHDFFNNVNSTILRPVLNGFLRFTFRLLFTTATASV
jgi:hypothetical protein